MCLWVMKKVSASGLLKTLFSFLPGRPVQSKPSRLLWESSSHAAINVQKLSIPKYPPLSITKYSFIKLSELE